MSGIEAPVPWPEEAHLRALVRAEVARFLAELVARIERAEARLPKPDDGK